MPNPQTTIDYEAAYRRLRQAADEARILIGGSFWEKPRAMQESNINKAWHQLDDAVHDYLPTRTP